MRDFAGLRKNRDAERSGSEKALKIPRIFPTENGPSAPPYKMPFRNAKRTYRRKPKTSRRAARKPKTGYARPGGPRTVTTMRAPRATVQKGYHPFGLTFLGRLHYGSNQQLAPTSLTGVAITNQYRLNTMYDPDITFTGHQPMQFDQVMAMYQNFIVYKAKVELTFTNPSVDGLWVGFKIRQFGDARDASGKTLDELQEMRDCPARPLNNTGSQVTKLAIMVPTHIPFGITKSQFWADEDFIGSAAADSVRQVILDVWALSLSSTGGADAVNYKINITYYAKFTNPLEVGQS